ARSAAQGHRPGSQSGVGQVTYILALRRRLGARGDGATLVAPRSLLVGWGAAPWREPQSAAAQAARRGRGGGRYSGATWRRAKHSRRGGDDGGSEHHRRLRHHGTGGGGGPQARRG